MEIRKIASYLLSAADPFCDYVPIVSTISNIVDGIAKKIIKNEASENVYVRHLQKKKPARCVIAAVPLIGNLAVITFDAGKVCYKIVKFCYKEMQNNLSSSNDQPPNPLKTQTVEEKRAGEPKLVVEEKRAGEPKLVVEEKGADEPKLVVEENGITTKVQYRQIEPEPYGDQSKYESAKKKCRREGLGRPNNFPGGSEGSPGIGIRGEILRNQHLNAVQHFVKNLPPKKTGDPSQEETESSLLSPESTSKRNSMQETKDPVVLNFDAIISKIPPGINCPEALGLYNDGLTNFKLIDFSVTGDPIRLKYSRYDGNEKFTVEISCSVDGNITGMHVEFVKQTEEKSADLQKFLLLMKKADLLKSLDSDVLLTKFTCEFYDTNKSVVAEFAQALAHFFLAERSYMYQVSRKFSFENFTRLMICTLESPLEDEKFLDKWMLSLYNYMTSVSIQASGRPKKVPFQPEDRAKIKVFLIDFFAEINKYRFCSILAGKLIDCVKWEPSDRDQVISSYLNARLKCSPWDQSNILDPNGLNKFPLSAFDLKITDYNKELAGLTETYIGKLEGFGSEENFNVELNFIVNNFPRVLLPYASERLIGKFPEKFQEEAKGKICGKHLLK